MDYDFDDGNHGDGSERYAAPWSFLTLLLVGIGGALSAVKPMWALAVFLVAGGTLLVRRVWLAVSGYPRGRKGR